MSKKAVIVTMKEALVLSLSILFWLGCRAQSSLPGASVEECFVGGRLGYANEFLSKIDFPDSLRTKENLGSVYYEIEVDTSASIVNFRVVRSLHPVLDNEVRTKIQATQGMWKPLLVNGSKSPYRIVDHVYFELR